MTPRAVGPYCPWPREWHDGTCIHPPGCADVVVELRDEHLQRLDSRNQPRRMPWNHRPVSLEVFGPINLIENGSNANPITETKGPRHVGKHTNERVRGPKEMKC